MTIVRSGSFVRSARFFAFVLASVALTMADSHGQEHSDDSEGDKEQDNKTPKNYLTFTMGYVGTAVSRKQDKNFPKETNIVFADRFSGTIEVRPEHSKDGITWYPLSDNLSVEGTISETFTVRSGLMGEGEVRATETSVTAYTGYPVCEANLVNALVKIRPEEKLYDLQFTLMPDMASTMESVLESKEHDIIGASSLGGQRKKEPSPPQVVPLDMGPNQMSLGISNYNLVVEVKGEPLSGDASKLTGTKRIPVPRPAGWNGAWDLAMEVNWAIDVSLPPVELVVTVPGYAQWRPKASIGKPNEPGNDLTAKATLKSKVGKVKYLPEVKHIRFQLLDTSREPGICMNWPLGAKDDDYDLRLAEVAGGTLSQKDQMLEVKEPKRNDEGQPYAEVRIDSFDFGGRASLRVVCLLEDGREIEGVMKGEGGGQDMVRLPNMKGPGWIADSWRKKHNAQKLADDADDEEVKGQKDNGDGYTLYEEYRGWVVARKHVEGDPFKKDFFVLNLIGGDAEPGIELFEQLSQLRVHAKLRRNEMSAQTRLMNGNHRDAPQNKPQHGVWLKTFASRSALGDDGAMTVMNQKGVAGRPGLVDGIGILARDSTESAFNKPFNLAVGDAIFAYDRAIAHELLHSVGVEHHGSGDYNMIVGYASTRNPLNKIGRPYYGTSPDKPIDLRTEEGDDVARRDIPKYEEFRKFTDMMMQERMLKEGADYIKRNGAGYNGVHTPQNFADAQIEILLVYCFMHLNGVVGVEHGEHSGAEDCLMRYYFAKYYESKKPPVMGSKMYYLIESGTERIGMEICHDRRGTGVNAAGHRPQSRYGNTAGTAGNCFEQICPNDAIPPRTTN